VLRIVSLMLLPLLTAGCSDGPEMHPVTGTVTLDGKPLEGASVVFHPIEKEGALAAGKTDAQGKYELRIREQPGALAGKYQVTVLLTKTVGQRKNPDSDDDLKMTYIVPKKFNDPGTSGLEEEVPGKEAYDLKLISK